MYLDGFGKFLVIFVQKYFFLPLLKKFWAKKSLFDNFSKIQFLAKNLTILIDSLWNFLSKIYTSLVFKLCQKQFSQNLQFCEGGTILKWFK